MISSQLSLQSFILFTQSKYVEEEDNGDDEDAESESQDQSRRQTSQRRTSRKQSRPKKRKDNVTKEIIRYQSGTKLLIPKLPFQRYVHRHKITRV